ncbi:MAG: acyl--CoA ligase [Verrucomicrobia bacterium]|nr:acyl--CoA ligase [Verrucomicrobiota bacterium]
MNIVDSIFQRANPNAIAIISEDDSLTFGELTQLVDTLTKQMRDAGAFQSNGVARIGLSCPNGIAHVVLALAILRGGGCLVPVAGELPARERDALIRVTKVNAVLIGEGGMWQHPGGSTVQIQCPRFCATLLFAMDEVANAPTEFDEADFAALNPALIRFSSGTTGKSKGIVLSHETLLERITVANHGLKIGPEDRVVWILPMAHHFAVSIVLYLYHGATTILVSAHLALDVLNAGRKHCGTILYAAPFHHNMLAGDLSGLDWPTLRLAVSTAAPLPSATALAFQSRFGLPLAQGLGIIEVGLSILNTDAAHEKPGSIGRPQPGFTAELRDPDGGEVPDGEPGELFLRGPGMTDAYLIPWRTRQHILEDGWFRTGDLATKDADGHLHLVGRTHSVINVAGMKCFPEEIESVLCAHPEVRAARVFGKAHPFLGSMPVAEIIADNPEKPPSIPALISHCRAALAQYKIPVQFAFVEALPQTPSGKIKR